MNFSDKVVEWAVELQSIAQNGLAYCKNVYDIERFERIRAISAEMMAEKTGLSPEIVRGLFCNESGYQTPKLGTRAAIFRDGKILLVRENDGTWTLPGGWCEMNLSIAENTVKECLEEAGLTVSADYIIALVDKSKHNPPPRAHGIILAFVRCTAISGEFAANDETTASGYFGPDELPDNIAISKTSVEQIKMCFAANEAGADKWTVLFD